MILWAKLYWPNQSCFRSTILVSHRQWGCRGLLLFSAVEWNFLIIYFCFFAAVVLVLKKVKKFPFTWCNDGGKQTQRKNVISVVPLIIIIQAQSFFIFILLVLCKLLKKSLSSAVALLKSFATWRKKNLSSCSLERKENSLFALQDQGRPEGLIKGCFSRQMLCQLSIGRAACLQTLANLLKLEALVLHKSSLLHNKSPDVCTMPFTLLLFNGWPSKEVSSMPNPFERSQKQICLFRSRFP